MIQRVTWIKPSSTSSSASLLGPLPVQEQATPRHPHGRLLGFRRLHPRLATGEQVPPLVRPPPVARLPLVRPPPAAHLASVVARRPAACTGSARSLPPPTATPLPPLVACRPAACAASARSRPAARPATKHSSPGCAASAPAGCCSPASACEPVPCGLRRLSTRPAGRSPGHKTRLGRPRRLRSGRCSPASSSASVSRARPRSTFSRWARMSRDGACAAVPPRWRWRQGGSNRWTLGCE